MAIEKDEQIALQQEQIKALQNDVGRLGNMVADLTEHLEEEESIGGWGSAIVNFVLGKDKNGLFYFNALMKFYFVATISVVLRGNISPRDAKAYLHIFCCISGFVAGFRELIWDDDLVDQSIFSVSGFFFIQVFFFVVDLVCHIML